MGTHSNKELGQKKGGGRSLDSGALLRDCMVHSCRLLRCSFITDSYEKQHSMTCHEIDLYPLLHDYDVWGEIVGINCNIKRWR